MDLTKRQKEIFDYIRKYAAKTGYPPTVREIGKAVGLHSSSTVHAHLANLEKIGLLRRDPTKPRAIELLVDKAKQALRAPGLPLVGEVAAGEPILAEENIEEYLELPWGDRRRGRGLHPARQGRLDEGRRDPRGRFVVVKQAEDAANGEIVVALLERRGDREALLPREGQDPPAAGELRLQADPHEGAPSSWARSSGSSGASDECDGHNPGPHARRARARIAVAAPCCLPARARARDARRPDHGAVVPAGRGRDG